MFLDSLIFHFLNGLRGNLWLTDILGGFLAKYSGYFLLVLFCALVFGRLRNPRRRIFVFLVWGLSAVIGRGLITETIRFFYSRPRPLSGDDAFPSGHMAFYVPLVLTVYFFLGRKWGLFFGAVVGLMGIARVFIGFHWPTDILGGAAVGALGYYLSYLILKKHKV